MRSGARMLLAFGLLMPMSALAADSPPMMAGRWEEITTGTSGTFNGQPASKEVLERTNVSKHVCVTAEQSANPELYFKRVSGGSCRQPEGVVKDGRVTLAGTCGGTPSAPAMSIDVEGTYSATSYRMEAKARGTVAGGDFVANATVTGRFLGPCRGDEASSEPSAG